MSQTIITLVESGSERKLNAEQGELLSTVLTRNNAHIDMPCGGRGTCGACTVQVNGVSCCACQTKVDGDMLVELSRGIENIAMGTAAKKASNGNRMYTDYGIAVDIGTTTICVSLVNSAGRMDAVSGKNPQSRFGADVINRIQKYMEGEPLNTCVREALSDMIAELCQKNGISSEAVDAAVITGNTAMLYLFAGQNPEALSHAPFEADRLFGEYIDANELGLPLSQGAKVYLTRCVSAFVGGDMTTAIVASGMVTQNDSALLADIGTNGEIALWRDGKLICCSTAAGPAFEGAGIRCGVYGIKGAIDHVWHEDKELRISTIANAPETGMCGSGIIDAMAVMLELEIIDETGAFQEDDDFYPIKNDIGIDAKDVRQIQLAKGSVRAGIETLLDVTGGKKEDIQTFYIAGGFGNFLKLESAAKIGLVPTELLHCAKSIGNAAHTGAESFLQDKSLVDFSDAFARNAETLPLDANPVFAENYMRFMMFE